MARSSTKAQRRLMIKWVVALGAILAVMVGIVLLLPKPAESVPEPTPTETTYTPRPTTSNEQFTYDDFGFLSCTTRPSVAGIDVSYHQGVIDWALVAENGVRFAFIRLGYRGYEDGQLHEDAQARRNLAEAKAQGLLIGAYLFSQAITPEEAAQEAAFALEILGDVQLDLPLAFDWEYVSDSARTAEVSSETLMECVDTFCSAVEAAGVEPMVYFNQDLAKTKLKLKELDYPFWLAKYSDNLDYSYLVRCWQYTDKGRIPGIEGFVDIDLYFP